MDVSKQLNGYLLVDKEVGITSYDVIRRLKCLLPRKYKIGHAGTLDPFASGLLILMLGKATKTWSKLQQLSKVYEVVANFGYETDTQDSDGKVVSENDTIVSEEIIKEAMEGFKGDILQTPPAYSAKKINGKRAYELARAGKEVKLTPKQITIYDFELLNYAWPRVTFKAEVGSGTYIRTLVTDLARSVDAMATAVELRRSAIGGFFVENAVKSSEIDEYFDIESRLIPPLN